MARARNIKPGFFKNDELGDCEPLARLLFAGLWTMADRDGRLEDRPKMIKAECLPYDNCDVEELLGQLSDHGFIRRYQAGGKNLVDIPKFSSHQNPHKDERSRGLPSFDDPAPNSHSASTVQVLCNNGSAPADSLLPTTDSLSSDSGTLNPEMAAPAPAGGADGEEILSIDWEADWQGIADRADELTRSINLKARQSNADRISDRSLVIKVVALSLKHPALRGEHWLPAVVSQIRARRRVNSPAALLTKSLGTKCTDLGLNFKRLLASISVPDKYLRPPSRDGDP